MSVQSETARPGSGRRPARVALAVLAALTLLGTTASATAWTLATRLTGNITVVDVSGQLGARPSEAPLDPEQEYQPVTILVMGTDTRTGQGSGFGDASTTSSGNGFSDTAIVLHVSADRSRALAVSIPRDSWVERPACDDSGGTVEGKFNEAFANGGPACTIKAVEALTKVRMDHYVVVDFRGFRAIVDALDGIPVCLEEAVDDEKSGLKLSAGNHVLDGDQALAFARARKTLGDGSDISRIDRQQVFLSALVRKASEQNVLTDLPTLYGVLDAATSSLTTDPGLGSLDRLKDLALSMGDLRPADVRFVTVPWKARGDGVNIVWNEEKADEIWTSMRKDSAWPPKASVPAGESEPLTTAPEDIRVEVLNGSGTPGQASKAADQLRKLGFVVTSVANADRSDYAATTVVHDPRYDESARTLAFASKASAVLDDGSGRTLTLIVGKDWSGVRAVTVAGSGSGSTDSPSNPTPKPADEVVCVS